MTKGRVQPIRSKAKINEIKRNLRKQSPRDYLLFVIGINSALRASDLLGLRKQDLIDEVGNIKDYFIIRQQKTHKLVRCSINNSMREALQFYLKTNGHLSRGDYFFTSYRSNRKLDNVAFWYLVQKWTAEAGLNKENYGCHSLRKTWGHAAWQAGIDPWLIATKLGHSNIHTVKCYLGISDEEVAEVERKINL